MKPGTARPFAIASALPLTQGVYQRALTNHEQRFPPPRQRPFLPWPWPAGPLPRRIPCRRQAIPRPLAVFHRRRPPAGRPPAPAARGRPAATTVPRRAGQRRAAAGQPDPQRRPADPSAAYCRWQPSRGTLALDGVQRPPATDCFTAPVVRGFMTPAYDDRL